MELELEWNWNGMEWNGMEWNGMYLDLLVHLGLVNILWCHVVCVM